MGYQSETEVPLLARIWHEDDVWKVSAFDLPIVAYGEHLGEGHGELQIVRAYVASR